MGLVVAPLCDGEKACGLCCDPSPHNLHLWSRWVAVQSHGGSGCKSFVGRLCSLWCTCGSGLGEPGVALISAIQLPLTIIIFPGLGSAASCPLVLSLSMGLPRTVLCTHSSMALACCGSSAPHLVLLRWALDFPLKFLDPPLHPNTVKFGSVRNTP